MLLPEPELKLKKMFLHHHHHHHRNSKLSTLIIIIITIFITAITADQNNNHCKRRCGKQTVNYPFGFSEGCKIELTCSNNDNQIKIGNSTVQKLNSDSIFISLPAKCNRSTSFIYPLFGKNYAPTWNNTFLVQRCNPSLNGCVIPTSIFAGTRTDVEGCDSRKSDNITCFTQLQRKRKREDVLTVNDWKKTGCELLFSAIAVDDSTVDEVPLQFQVVELGWWLEGPCLCTDDANCTEVRLAGGKQGFRCRCREGLVGDGFVNGTGCQRASHCSLSTLGSSKCAKALRIGLLLGVIIIGASVTAALSLVCYFTNRRSTWLTKQLTVRRLLREAAGNYIVPLYPYKEVERATNFFSEKHRLGTGAYGTVYAGNLHNNELVAIKKIRYRDTNSVDQVMNEIKLLSSVSHPNLVRLLGCCIEKGEHILVYEYMPNGTLSQHLQRERGGTLPWTIRLTIASETANAVAFLHSSNPPIYHRDIKSSNILLDFSFQSKVADFGLSRLGMTEISHISTAPQGTPGYVDPQYHQNFHLSDKSDVYSFGVVLVEIITAMKVVDFGRPQSEINLAALAIEKIRKGRVDDIIDPFLDLNRDAWTLYSVNKVAELAFRCLAFHSESRPSMIEVAEELDHIRRSGWATMEETICLGSSVGSGCSSPRYNGNENLVSKNEILVVPQKTNSFLHTIEEVKDGSPESVHGTWSSRPSSPSTNSLLGNVVQ
ncbi:wall-associated receptor kinase-like 14 isoform X2 [Vicia villosa]|uniref:wall-associated receptor kinase-like 14 isoform X2 n=1 Tax=Vicia villosa TaxID=3911 RepID=UPI00273B16AA|nr:wall-associated receptor kinase-like 14 isoform X2 [Vicia villosa]